MSTLNRTLARADQKQGYSCSHVLIRVKPTYDIRAVSF